MLSTIGSCIEKPFERTLHLIEKRLLDLEPTSKPKDILILFIMGLGIGLTSWAVYLAEGFIGSALEVKAGLPLHWLHSPITYLVPLIAFFIGMLLTLVSRYVKDSNELRRQLKDAHDNLKEMKVNIGQLKSFESLAIKAIEDVLNQSEDKPPFKALREALSPPNSDLKHLIASVGEDTIKRLELLDKLNSLPAKIRDALRVFMGSDLMKQEWGNLYLTFAIKLQLEPWNSAARSNRFTFIRDIEEIACFYPSPDKARVAFQQQLQDDLEEILSLVNGSLHSVMYRDVKIWKEKEYLVSNEKLFAEKKTSAKLKRLFIFEESWLSNDEYLVPLICGAVWHKTSKYPGKFINVNAVDANLVRKANPNFLASCLINKTVIEMEQEESNSNPCRYKYICESDNGFREKYKKSFESSWEKALSPEDFLKLVKKDYSAMEKEYTFPINKNESVAHESE